MFVYSTLLALALAVSSPWWLWRMARSGRYRAGLRERLRGVRPELAAAAQGKRVVWLHAVSVGEVFASVRLIRKLGKALGPAWLIVVSTTTETGQQVARERFGTALVFYLPLDFARPIRRTLRALKPELMITLESELWPRLIVECGRAGIPTAVVNARISDRSLPRYLRLRALWVPLLNQVSVFLAQGEETAVRLRAIGVQPDRVKVTGNLKYDLTPCQENAVAAWIRGNAGARQILVAGSTLPGARSRSLSEEELLIQAWEGALRQEDNVLLVLAPRHPDRFGEVFATAAEFAAIRASEAASKPAEGPKEVEIVLLDTLGDLASVYGVADLAFVGGSLVSRGGHNPLEAARFGVPVVMGPSYENFREIVDGMRTAGAIRIVEPDGLAEVLRTLLREDGGLGERGRCCFEAQAGATGRTVTELLKLIRSSHA